MTKDLIEKLKLSPKDLKPKFQQKKWPDGIRKLRNLVRDRIQEGRDFNLGDYKYWWAMDVAYDAPFRQVTPTVMQSFLDTLSTGDYSSEEVLKKAEAWGLTKFIRTVKNEGKEKKELDIPIMFKIVLPLARAYLNIRWAKLFNDRDLHPLLKFEPIKFTSSNRLRCEILTDRVEFMNHQFGYRSTLRQWIFNALHYGISMMFPTEDWYIEDELYIDANGTVKKRIGKEGLRYNIPHPSRVFYDQAHRIGTINSDSGCEYAGYWRIARYRDVLYSGKYWNTERVSIYRHDLIRNNRIFFNTVYPCQMEFPTDNSLATTGAGMMDRESGVAYYTTSQEDKAVVLTDIYMKFSPKEFGLADYEPRMWFRMVMANDDDFLYVAPICYTPPLYMGYDYHEERNRNSSLTLEILPFQDHMSNLMTQTLLAAKANMAKAVFVNSDLVSQQYLDKIENMGEDFYRCLNFIPYSQRTTKLKQDDVRQAFFPVNFPVMNTVELTSAIRMLLDALERVLVFSAQEVGAVAAHEQTAEEVRVIGGAVSNRLQLTSSFIDDAIQAWKKQLYQALMGYGHKEVWGQIPSDPPVDEALMKKIGFTVDEPGIPGISNTLVKGPLSSLKLEGFSSDREADDRINNVEVAGAMTNVLQFAMQNPVASMAIGADQFIQIINEIARIAGLPRDFKLVVKNRDKIKEIEGGQPSEAQQMMQQMQQTVAQLAEELMNKSAEQSAQITQEAVAPLAEAVQANGEQIKMTQEAIPPIAQSVEEISARLAQLTQLAMSENGRNPNPTK
ncbi:MAG: hypothetical protein ACWGQW_05255 [bacterium]